MTYEESYRKIDTVEKLKKEVESDIAIAIMINRDRIPIILNSANKVLKEKFNSQELLEEV